MNDVLQWIAIALFGVYILLDWVWKRDIDKIMRDYFGRGE